MPLSTPLHSVLCVGVCFYTAWLINLAPSRFLSAAPPSRMSRQVYAMRTLAWAFTRDLLLQHTCLHLRTSLRCSCLPSLLWIIVIKYLVFECICIFTYNYTIWPKVYGHHTITCRSFLDIPFPNHGCWYVVGSSLQILQAPLFWLSANFWSLPVGICAHPDKSAYVRSGTGIGWEGLAHNRQSNSFQGYSVGLRSWFCADHRSLSTPNSPNWFFMEVTLCTRAPLGWIRTGFYPNCCHIFGTIQLSKMSLYAVTLTWPFTGPKPWNTAIDHYPSFGTAPSVLRVSAATERSGSFTLPWENSNIPLAQFFISWASKIHHLPQNKSDRLSKSQCTYTWDLRFLP